jgi:hypothetical protein
LTRLRLDILTAYNTNTPTSGSDLKPQLAGQTADIPHWFTRIWDVLENTSTLTLGDSKDLDEPEWVPRWKKAIERTKINKPNTIIPAPDEEAGLRRAKAWLKDQVDAIVRSSFNPKSPDFDPKHPVPDLTKYDTPLARVIKFIWAEILSLKAVPHNYSFPEPDILGEEAIFTYYVDLSWLDAMIDGILSINNHSSDEDFIKDGIKDAINAFLAVADGRDEVDGSKSQLDNIQPRIPTWGMIICGQLVKTFPDLQVRQGKTDTGSERIEAINLLHTVRLQKDATLLIFDCFPEQIDQQSGLFISQPPHQQRFVAATTLTKNEAHFEFPTVSNTTSKMVNPVAAVSKYDAKDMWNPETRCLHMGNFLAAYTVVGVRSKGSGPRYFRHDSSPADIAIALSERIFEMRINTQMEHLEKFLPHPCRPLFQVSIPKRKENASMQMLVANSARMPRLSASSGKFPIRYHMVKPPKELQSAKTQFSAKMVAAATNIPTRLRAKSIKAEILANTDAELTTPLVKFCRALNSVPTLDGESRAVDMLVCIKLHPDLEVTSDFYVTSIQVLITMQGLLLVTTPTPTTRMVGSSGAAWVLGEAAEEDDDGPVFSVQLTASAETSLADLDLSFVVSGGCFEPNSEPEVVLDFKESYILKKNGRSISRSVNDRVVEKVKV